MNIAMLQTMSMKPTQVNATKAADTTSKLSSESNEFGTVFSSIMSSSTNTATVTPEEQPGEMAVLGAVESALSMETLGELFEELGIELDEAGLFALIGEDAEPVALDQMLNLENLTEALGLTEEQLTEIVEQLLGEQMEEITDVWSLIEQAPAILSQILAVLQGSEQAPKDVQPKELQQVVQLLKLAELVGQKTDTVYQQEFKLSQLTEVLKATLTQVQQTVVVQTKQEVTKVTFQQVVQTAKVETEVSQPVVQQPTVQAKPVTITVTLPAEKPAQSEALLKEIQNIMNRSQLTGQQGNMKLLLKLFPENLGQIRIELVQQNGVLTARLLASTALGKELLDSNLNQLKASFTAQNIQMDRLDVAQSLQETDRGNRDQNFLNNFFRQQEEQNNDEEVENDEEKETFQDLLNAQNEEVE